LVEDAGGEIRLLRWADESVRLLAETQAPDTAERPGLAPVP
jgi:hypothetical protein